MTTLLALYDAKEKRGWMASDGRGTASGVVITESEAKITQADPWLIGVSGSGRALNLVQQH